MRFLLGFLVGVFMMIFLDRASEDKRIGDYFGKSKILEWVKKNGKDFNMLFGGDSWYERGRGFFK